MLNLINIPQPTDLNRDRGIDAYRWMSMNPEKRADGDIAGYVKEVLDFAADLEAIAETDVQKAEAVAQVERYRLKAIEWNNTLWAAKSRTASPMITGPARFPVDRNRKAMDAEQKKVTAWLEYLPRAKAAARKAVLAAGAPPVVPEKPNATVTIGSVEIVTNYEIERVQMFFPGKPEPDKLAALKGAGWNWSPRNKAWQRMITDNTMRSAKRIAEGT
jgi:hypothetical protein